MPLDLPAVWDFHNPELSEQRFRAALDTASGDDALILQTQIARTWGLRGDFAQARQMLAGPELVIQNASPEARIRYNLEMGRTCSSAAPVFP